MNGAVEAAVHGECDTFGVIARRSIVIGWRRRVSVGHVTSFLGGVHWSSSPAPPTLGAHVWRCGVGHRTFLAKMFAKVISIPLFDLSSLEHGLAFVWWEAQDGLVM